jgi:hypothetical protein
MVSLDITSGILFIRPGAVVESTWPGMRSKYIGVYSDRQFGQSTHRAPKPLLALAHDEGDMALIAV